MRDNSEDMLELVDALKIDGQYFAVIRIDDDENSNKYKFGVTEKGYGALKRILQTRPFDSMPGLKHKYFFNRSIGPDSIGVRIEVGDSGKEIDFDIPNDLSQNMVWFFKLDDMAEAEYLKLED